MRSMNRRTALKTVLMAVLPGRAFRCSVGLDPHRHRPSRPLRLAGEQSVRPGHRSRRRALLLRSRQPADTAARFADASDDATSPATVSAHTPATAVRRRGSLNMPHEIAFDARGQSTSPNATITSSAGGRQDRRHLDARRDRRRWIIGRRGPASRAQLRQPHSIAVGPGRTTLICDVGNHRVRAVDLIDRTIETIGGTGERLPTPDGAPLRRARRSTGPGRWRLVGMEIYLALREGNAIYASPRKRARFTTSPAPGHRANRRRRPGAPGDARRAEGLALTGRSLYLADTENHAIRASISTAG